MHAAERAQQKMAGTVEPERNPSLGDPSRARVVCRQCSSFLYLDRCVKSRDPRFAAEYVVKDCCPRKARCQPWRDRGCQIEFIDAQSADASLAESLTDKSA
jgi:hypothetical protein